MAYSLFEHWLTKCIGEKAVKKSLNLPSFKSSNLPLLIQQIVAVHLLHDKPCTFESHNRIHICLSCPNCCGSWVSMRTQSRYTSLFIRTGIYMGQLCLVHLPILTSNMQLFCRDEGPCEMKLSTSYPSIKAIETT